MMDISICVAVKNRSRVRIPRGDVLELLPNSIASMANCVDKLPWLNLEVIVADFQSSDWPLANWFVDYPGRFSRGLVKCEGGFSRGGGLNVAAARAVNDLIFFCDADILIGPGFFDQLRDIGSRLPFFPVIQCIGMDGLIDQGNLLHCGHGLVVTTRDLHVEQGSWPEFVSHGGEDIVYWTNAKKRLRRKSSDLVHQWHPNYLRHVNYSSPANSCWLDYNENM